MSEIAKCPFCGGEAEITGRQWGDTIEYLVRCKNIDCVACNTHYLGEQDAIAAWNRRAQPDGCEWEKRQIVDCFGDTRTGYHCSNCGFLTDVEWPFCPKCGAKMKGKRLGE